MSDITAWLEELGLGRYDEVFAENEIEFDVLVELTEEHLKDMSLPLGPQLKLLKAIARLKQASPEITRSSTEEPAATSPNASQAERRQLTVMFVDLVGSTALSGQLDPEDLSVIMRRY